MQGWIKLHRKLLENPVVMKDIEHFAVWIYLLLSATHAEYPAMFKGRKIVLLPGQLITGSIAIGNVLGINESKVRRILNNLKSDGQIDRQVSNKNSLITVLNWELYQNTDGQNEEQVTDNRQTSDGQVTTNKNIKNIKNERKAFIPPSVDEVMEYCRSRNNGVDAEKFISFYTAKGWMIGKNKMRDWKAAVRTWETDKKGGKADAGRTEQRADYEEISF